MKGLDLLRSAISTLELHQIADARFDAELLLVEACGLSRASLLAHLDDTVDDATASRFAALIERRARHEPIAYIRGHKEFYGLDLLVDRRVLIPRPETELLVECALKWLRAKCHVLRVTCHVVDVGTGSGAIAIAIAYNSQSPITMVGVDVSLGALAVARANAARHHLSERIQFVQSDLLSNVDVRADLIVANLPYVSHAEWRALAPDIADYEPRLALDGGADGLDAFRKFFAQAPSHLATAGVIMLEIGWRQAESVSALAQAAFPQATIGVVKDDAGLDRVVIVQT